MAVWRQESQSRDGSIKNIIDVISVSLYIHTTKGADKHIASGPGYEKV